MWSIPISFLPMYVIMVVALGEAATSSKSWAIQYIQRYQVTSEQVERLRMIENQYSGRIGQFLQQLNQAQRELIELVVGTASSSQIRERERQFEALQIQAAQVYFDEFLEIREVLTPEQRRQFDPLQN